MFRLELVLLTLCVAFRVSLTQDPSVQTTLGKIIGIKNDVTFQGTSYTIDRYLGIPYAKPPVGSLRFLKPVAYGQFPSGTIEAKNFASPCAQFGTPSEEDCLFLNVFVPTQPADQTSGHAVMVFIHGGGFVSGSTSLYTVDTSAGYGNVIVVTISYRVWLFGFLNLEMAGAAGNMGLFDQHMAIQWVHDHIMSFGGDPNRVTVFGQSAGSGSTAFQSLYPGNRGLFTSVITESGTPFNRGAMNVNNIDRAKLLASKLRCDDTTEASVLTCLQSASVKDMFDALGLAFAQSPREASQLMIFAPTIDGDFIKRMPRELLNDTNSDEVQFFRSLNLINGFNTGEGGLFISILYPMSKTDDFSVTRETMDSVYIPTTYKNNYAVDSSRDPEKEIVKLIAHEYTDWSGPNDPSLLLDQLQMMMGDLTFGTTAVEYSRLHSGGGTSNSNSYLYLFAFEAGGHVVASQSWMSGALHGDEIPYLFAFPVPLPQTTSNGTVVQPEPRDFDMSARMMTRWSNFAKTRDPNVQGEQTWPEFTTSREEYLKIDWTDTTGQHLMAHQIDFWANVLPKVENALRKEKNHCDRTPGGPVIVG